jgi:hypothetical protein
MNSASKKLTPRLIINKFLRIPQRQEVTRLNCGVTTIIETYKNKKLIFVTSSKNERFNNPI